MSIKPLPSSTSSAAARRTPEPVAARPAEAPKPNLLERMGQGLQNVAREANRLVDGFEAKLPDLSRLGLPKLPGAGNTPWAGITLTGKPLQIPLDKLLQVDLGDLRKVLERILPPKIDDKQGKQLVAQTKDFRDTLGQVRSLAAQLDMLPSTHPRYPQVKAALEKAEAQLTQTTGYTRATAPRPGSLWLDPQFLAKELPGGQVHASRFPTGTPVTKPPSALDIVSGGDAKKAAEYTASVARNRAEAGMPVQGGEPMGVHLSLEGGGGKGKRYAAMFAEMRDLGVVPVSLTGTSAGSIAAAFAATGATPQQIEDVAKDPRLGQLYDFDLDLNDGGLLDGQAAFDLFDQKLRELTGITDRPVTFADLKIPLQLVAAKAYDSAVPDGGFKSAQDRIFVFSQETTPDTPVALAMRASMAIPGVFDPVQVVDPVTGRQMHLVDGGTLDNLPMGYAKNDLPQIGASLQSRGGTHPSNGTAQPKPLPTGQLDTDDALWNGFNGYAMLKDNATEAQDWRDKAKPGANQFMLAVPTWNLDDPKQGNSVLGFGYDAKVDPKLDTQTRQVTRDFLREFMDDMKVPGSRGTNLVTQVPKDLKFSEDVQIWGEKFQVTYSGGDTVVATAANGKRHEVRLGQKQIEALWLDGQTFKDFDAQLSHVLSDVRSVRPSWLPF
ncbi:patatin-like phospholipase family protein [Myxococcus sp. MISCRS1]|uniref:patatin-like phospholipase family protein n=1 Tax=unclassified Myxococcus TaxID=2648731 RepID=UPI001CBE7DFC|nr:MULTISPECIES: patatin-like phospholipase family protein [unclassified Myxococcus]MBZ4398544.1 patatin-like phospholipase family protein [Myxococcus sp. AS-1-15]MCY1000218.1 patatin-like phospholipase family protein [Myxococcus sp. MISCRS1]